MEFKEIVSNFNEIKEFQKGRGGVSETPPRTPPKREERERWKRNF